MRLIQGYLLRPLADIGTLDSSPGEEGEPVSEAWEAKLNSESD